MVTNCDECSEEDQQDALTDTRSGPRKLLRRRSQKAALKDEKEREERKSGNKEQDVGKARGRNNLARSSGRERPMWLGCGGETAAANT